MKKKLKRYKLCLIINNNNNNKYNDNIIIILLIIMIIRIIAASAGFSYRGVFRSPVASRENKIVL